EGPMTDRSPLLPATISSPDDIGLLVPHPVAMERQPIEAPIFPNIKPDISVPLLPGPGPDGISGGDGLPRVDPTGDLDNIPTNGGRKNVPSDKGNFGFGKLENKIHDAVPHVVTDAEQKTPLSKPVGLAAAGAAGLAGFVGVVWLANKL